MQAVAHWAVWASTRRDGLEATESQREPIAPDVLRSSHWSPACLVGHVALTAWKKAVVEGAKQLRHQCTLEVEQQLQTEASTLHALVARDSTQRDEVTTEYSGTCPEKRLHITTCSLGFSTSKRRKKAKE
eukprot:6234539-Amphidinium_carterae.2